MSEGGAREREIAALARRISELGAKQRARVFHLSWWSDRLLARSMSDPAFRTRLFRFVDAFPAMRDDEDVEEHLLSQFEGTEMPAWLGAGLGLTRTVPGGARLSMSVARRGIDRMARQFVIGTEPEEVAKAVGGLWSARTAATVDVLGEHTHSESEADAYAARLAGLVEALGAAAADWGTDALLERDSLGSVPRASVSVKVSALSSSYSPLTAEEGVERAAHRILPILRRASELGVSVWFDMERFEEKELTHRLFRRVLAVPGMESLHAGIVVQAYLRDSAEDLQALALWARGRRTPVSVRLVKGAYWDTETIESRARGWEVPVFERKEDTDASFERLAQMLLGFHGNLRAAFATHNLRSLSAAVVDARGLGISDGEYEMQLLYGMAEPVHEAVRRLGLRLRVYAPVGDLVPGMAYLVRRLLENTSNESFVRHHFAEGEALGELLAPPSADALPGPAGTTRREATDPLSPAPYRPEPPAEFRREEVMSQFASAVDAEFSRQPRKISSFVCGEEHRSGPVMFSLDPSDAESVVAEVRACGADDVDRAVRGSVAAAERWRAVPSSERAAVLFKAAELMRSRRFELAALETRETAKGWTDADADVCEAIDYCEYYGREMLSLARGRDLDSPRGEENRLFYRGRGVCVVVSPWNFPLAIPTGMTAAAIVTGNSVILKPAEQSPAVAWQLFEVFSKAGLPRGVFSFMPGDGNDVGSALVSHPLVDTIAFTGSKEVGLEILEHSARRTTGRRSLARVVAELGGKNAIVVDSDADLDEVVPAVVASAFGFAGQKCSAASRLIAVESIHDAVVRRVVEAARSLVVGPTRLAGSQVGPVIDADAHERLLASIARAGEVGTVLLERRDVPGRGWFVGPVVVADVEPESWLAKEELFGPVLATFRAKSFSDALDLANDSEYALTAGVFSRSPEHVRQATDVLRAGNVYVNRAITGAVVGRQPFGGTGMSGVGHKAGGPDYLIQFCESQVVAENTMRQGFAPERSVEPEASEQLAPDGAPALENEPENGKRPAGPAQGAA